MKDEQAMRESEIRATLKVLRPDVPWAHHFDFGYGIVTVTPDNAHYLRKATALKAFAEQVIAIVKTYIAPGGLRGMRVLDMASAEGGHAIAYAQAGAREVIGVEGRQLHVDRANFAAEALGVSNVSFRQGDVRKLEKSDLGTFDLVICCGILYHIDIDHYYTVVRSCAELTTDASIIFTHVAVPHNATVTEPDEVQTPEGYRGRLYREHADEDDTHTRTERHRYSLDNTMSFWPVPSELNRAVADAGFVSIVSPIHPHPFENFEQATNRPILIARKRLP